MQVVQHLHLQGVVAHGDVAVLRHHKIDAHPRILVRLHARLDGLEAKQRLRKYLLRRSCRAAPGRCNGSRPRRPPRPAAFRNVPSAAARPRQRARPRGPRPPRRAAPGPATLAKLRQVRVPPDLVRNLGRVAKGRRLHQFQILLILRRGAAGHLVHPFARVPLVQPAKRAKVAKNWSCPLHRVGTKLRIEKASISLS